MKRHALLDRLKSVAASPPAEYHIQLVAEEEQMSATRLAETVIQANTSVLDRTVWVMAARGSQTGLTTVSDLSLPSLRRAVDAAVAIAETAGEDTGFPGFRKTAHPIVPNRFDEATARQTPMHRARILNLAAGMATRRNLELSGVFTVKHTRRAISNSYGLNLQSNQTDADLSLTYRHPGGSSGWARESHFRADQIPVAVLAGRAADKAIRGQDPVDLPPGEYSVILEPPAVGSLILFLAFLSFGGAPSRQKMSFMAGKTGQPVISDQITLVDDPTDPHSGGWPFDYEGTPCRPLTLIEKGIARNPVYDMRAAAAAETESTGHALPPGRGFGPYPRCLHMSGGAMDSSRMIASVDRGILVTRLWYINYVNPMRTQITGTTRDGTFLIEKGKLTGAVRDMRFVESIYDVLDRSTAFSSDTWYVRQFGSTMSVPFVGVPGFKFTEVVS